MAPVPVYLPPRCVHVSALLVKTHAPPPPMPSGAPTTAVAPSPEGPTAVPCWPLAVATLPASLPPCCVQTPPLLVKTHAAPRDEESPGPPKTSVLPSEETSTDAP